MRGIPFDLGPDDTSPATPAWLGFGEGLSLEPVSIPVDQTVRSVVIAHATVESAIPDNGAVGVLVADYVFHLSDGTAHIVPVRDLFEIGVVPHPVSERTPERLMDRLAANPWLAVPDHYDRLHPRTQGPWAQAGRRMVECEQAFSEGFKLWVWAVPRQAALGAIEIRPAGPPFAIGGITVGRVDEHPFVRTGREPVLIERVGGESLPDPASLSVRVDRGVATYAWPVAVGTPERFLAAEVAGWGEPPPVTLLTAAAEVAAVRSATVEVLDGDTVIGAVRWGDVLAAGAATDDRVRIQWVDRTRHWIHTTVVDEATGRTVPCRIRFQSPNGIPWQPHGHHNHVNSDHESWHMDVGGDVRLGHVSYAVIDGRCQGWLPEGDVLVEVARGFEYEPMRATVRIERGQRDLRLGIRRWADLKSEGWVSADTHVHFLSVDGAHLEADAEDLQIVNLLQAQWGHLFTNSESFTGRPSTDPARESIVFVGQENRQHVLGHLSLLGIHAPVMPWSSDGPGEAELGGTMEATLSRWADEGRAAGGLVVAPHFAYPNGELAALIATGRLDAVEMIWQGKYFDEEYYRYLNAGYRLPLVGGTDKMTSDVPVGLYRTYAQLGPDQALTFDTWSRAVASGRTFLSAGPIVRLAVDGAGIGDTLRLPPGGGTVEIHAVAESASPIHTLQVVRAGAVVAEATDAGGARRLEVRERIPIDANSWIAARAGGPGYYGGRRTLCSFRRGVFAHTSPVYVACGEGAWTRDEPAVVEYMMTRIQGVLSYIQETAATTRVGGGGHLHDEADHEAWLAEPLHEAMHLLARRLG